MRNPAENPNSSDPRTHPSTKRSGRRWVYGVIATGAVAGVWLGVSSGAGADRNDTAVEAVVPGETGPTSSQAPDEADLPSEKPGPSSSAEQKTPPSGPAVEATRTDAPIPDEESGKAAAVDPALTGKEPGAEVAVQEFAAATKALDAVRAEATPQAGLEDLAAGPALEELQVQVAELAANRWSSDGAAEVTTIEVLDDPSPGQETLQIQACIDSSSVSLTDENGAIIQAEEPAGTRRSLNLYDLELRDGAWIVVNHYFPDNADC